MFSAGKNWILNTLKILCIPQNFWPRKGPEYLYQLSSIWCFTQEDNMWNESSSSIQVYIQQWFHDGQGGNFIVIRNNFGHVLMGDLIFNSILKFIH